MHNTLKLLMQDSKAIFKIMSTASFFNYGQPEHAWHRNLDLNLVLCLAIMKIHV